MRYDLHIIIFLGAISLVNCQWNTEFTELRLDPNFNNTELTEIIRGHDVWCRVSDQACLPISIADSTEDANVILVTDWSDKYPENQCAGYFGDWIELVRKGDCFPNAYQMAHEIGHALAPEAGGINKDGHLMSHTAVSSQCITQTDIDHLCENRQCNNWKPACI